MAGTATAQAGTMLAQASQHLERAVARDCQHFGQDLLRGPLSLDLRMAALHALAQTPSQAHVERHACGSPEYGRVIDFGSVQYRKQRVKTETALA
jgi:hypothetical protein